jgi:predicted Zn-dependent peptidase
MLRAGSVAGAALRKLFVPALFLLPATAWTQAAAETQPEPILPFTQFTLENGLTLIVREDHKLPIVSVEVVYQVGSRDDPPDKSGLAHLFEHLLFYGSQHHPHNFLVAMQKLGGTNVNGGTGPDLTSVYQTVPISQLDAVLWLESDRMGYLLPAVTQKTLDEQVELIRNEINMGRDEPGGEARFHSSAGDFPPDQPYHREPGGDLQGLVLDGHQVAASSARG